MPETTLPKSTAELISTIEREWSALMHVVDQLSPRQMNRPDTGGWSPRDNLAHLTEWMKILLGYHMDKRPAHKVVGLTPEVTRDWDMDVINKFLFERNRRRTSKKVLEELKQVYAEVIARLKATPFDELMEARFDEDAEKQPLLNWVLGNTADHFSEHRLNIEKILEL